MQGDDSSVKYQLLNWLSAETHKWSVHLTCSFSCKDNILPGFIDFQSVNDLIFSSNVKFPGLRSSMIAIG
jgi:hypothetical protein